MVEGIRGYIAGVLAGIGLALILVGVTRTEPSTSHIILRFADPPCDRIVSIKTFRIADRDDMINVNCLHRGPTWNPSQLNLASPKANAVQL